MQLQGCAYRGGRAESAALTRTQGLQKELGLNDPALSTCQAPVASDNVPDSTVLLDPVMPHLVFSADELDRRYPSIDIPEHVTLRETEDQADRMLEIGEPIIEDIVRRAGDYGLLRREK